MNSVHSSPYHPSTLVFHNNSFPLVHSLSLLCKMDGFGIFFRYQLFWQRIDEDLCPLDEIDDDNWMKKHTMQRKKDPFQLWINDEKWKMSKKWKFWYASKTKTFREQNRQLEERTQTMKKGNDEKRNGEIEKMNEFIHEQKIGMTKEHIPLSPPFFSLWIVNSQERRMIWLKNHLNGWSISPSIHKRTNEARKIKWLLMHRTVLEKENRNPEQIRTFKLKSNLIYEVKLKQKKTQYKSS